MTASLSPIYSSVCFGGCFHWWHNVSGLRNVNGQVWRDQCTSECGYPPGRSPPSWHEVVWAIKLFCGFGAPFWAAFSTIYLHRHCAPGWMDSGSQLCYISPSLLGRFPHFGPTGFPCATTTFKPAFVCVKNLAFPFIQISWRGLRLVLQSLGLNLTPRNFRLASRLTRKIGLFHC